MNKQEYIWLTRNTEIDNQCDEFADCKKQKVIFKLFRKHHLPKIEEIFAGHDTQVLKDEFDFTYFEVKDMTLYDFCGIAMDYNSDIIYNDPNGRCYYDPADRKKYEHIFRRSTPRELAQLSDRKKLDVLMAINKDCYMRLRNKLSHEQALDRNSDKINALLQLPIPKDFWEHEQRKIRLIAAEIAKMPGIKEKLENFHNLSEEEQRKIFKQTCKITAKYNRIDVPVVRYLSSKQMEDQTADTDWASPEAFASEYYIFVNKDRFKKLTGVQVMSLAWHETNHIAMAYGDYSSFGLMEDILNKRLDYINEIEQAYIFHPQEKINYALEKQLIEEIVTRTGVKADDKTMKMHSEYTVALQYMAKSLNQKGR